MKTIFAVVVAMTIIAAIAWQNRLELLVIIVPVLNDIRNPVPANKPISWEQGPESAQTVSTERPPNVILILADDMGFNDLSLYNGGAADGTVMTPNIDALASEGVRFNNGYAGAAVCAPSRATILTGRYPTRFGFEFNPTNPSAAMIARWMQDIEEPDLPVIINEDAVENMPPMASLGMPSSEITIAEMLKTRGYYTAHIGKWHVGQADGMHPLDQGFDESLNMNGTTGEGVNRFGLLYLPEDHPDVVNAKRLNQGVEKMIWANGVHSVFWNRHDQLAPEGYLTDYFTNEAVKVIENNQHRPFFLYLAHWAIHNPLQALAKDYSALSHIEDHHLRVYAAMIWSLDRSVGRITEALEAHGLDNNTLIIFSSDNGGAGYIGLPNINKPFRGWKLNQFEGGIHVPFLVKWPSRIRPGAVIETPVHHIDIFSTIAAAVGVDLPGDRIIDGVDLIPFVNGETDKPPHETLIWRQGHHQSVQHQGWKLIRADLPKDATWLFNLVEDPTEQHNLASAHPDRVKELMAQLDAHNATQAEPSWPSLLNTPQLIDKHGNQNYAPGDEYVYWAQ